MLTIFNARVKEGREAGPGPGEEGIDEFIEVIKRRRMVHAFTAGPGHPERLLRAANRAPSADFSQGYSFLVLEGKEEAAPFWRPLYEQTASEATTKDDSPAQVDALSTTPLVIVPLASKDVYLDRRSMARNFQRYAASPMTRVLRLGHDFTHGGSVLTLAAPPGADRFR